MKITLSTPRTISSVSNAARAVQAAGSENQAMVTKLVLSGLVFVQHRYEGDISFRSNHGLW